MRVMKVSALQFKLVAVLAYFVGLYWASMQIQVQWWMVLLFLTPFLFGLSQRLVHQTLALPALSAMTAVMVYVIPHWYGGDIRGWSWLQEQFWFLSILYFFSYSLQKGQQPVCTVFASLAHENLSPPLLAYTRRITKWWVIFFITCATISNALYWSKLFVPWTLFSNFLYPASCLCFFLIEVRIRPFFLPPQDCLGVWETVMAVKNGLTARKFVYK